MIGCMEGYLKAGRTVISHCINNNFRYIHHTEVAAVRFMLAAEEIAHHDRCLAEMEMMILHRSPRLCPGSPRAQEKCAEPPLNVPPQSRRASLRNMLGTHEHPSLRHGKSCTHIMPPMRSRRKLFRHSSTCLYAQAAVPMTCRYLLSLDSRSIGT